MMKPEEIKEALGEFYIDVNEEKNKKIYVEIINKFINLQPHFKPPLKNKNNLKNKIKLFCKNNDLHLLDTFYFTHSVPFQIKGGENTFFLCVDNDNIKHIYTIRGMWAEVRELNDRLGINTLINFYNAFVYNVVSPSKIMRDIKEVKMGIKNFKYPTNVCIKNIDKDYLTIHLINKLSFDDNKTLSIKCKTIEIDNRNCHIILNIDRDVNYNITSFDTMAKFFNKDNFITNENIDDLIKKHYELKLKKINEDINRTINHIHEIFNKN